VDVISNSLKSAQAKNENSIFDLDNKQAEVLKLSQQILKREWERVKAGEHSK
jgi:hypothetical protein